MRWRPCAAFSAASECLQLQTNPSPPKRRKAHSGIGMAWQDGARRMQGARLRPLIGALMVGG